jgi:predicted dehydrogenase
VTFTKQFGVAVIGLGRFGAKRIKSIAADTRTPIHVVNDVVATHSQSVADELGCFSSPSWQEAVCRDDVDIVVVSTSTESLSAIALAALQASKHVLVEKPFGRNADEVLPCVLAARENKVSLKVGYNHRYHPAVAKAHGLLREGVLGRIHFLRCVYGHGGRAGYDREWRTRAASAGGGQLLDQGVHALDLFRWFAGEFTEVRAFSATSFWHIAPLEDNIFALLRSGNGCVAQLHASWTSWKNTFQFEVSGEKGYLAVAGLGGHYGLERLVHGVRGELGTSPHEYLYQFPGDDQSLHLEWKDFVDCIERRQEPNSSGEDGWHTLKLADSIYEAARTGSESGLTPRSLAIPA